MSILRPQQLEFIENFSCFRGITILFLNSQLFDDA